MDLLFITYENKSHYVYVKDFNRFMCNKTKNKNKKHFCRYWFQYFSSEEVLIDHKKVCLKVNGKQSVKLRSSSIKFKNSFKQLAATEAILKENDYCRKVIKITLMKILPCP